MGGRFDQLVIEQFYEYQGDWHTDHSAPENQLTEFLCWDTQAFDLTERAGFYQVQQTNLSFQLILLGQVHFHVLC